MNWCRSGWIVVAMSAVASSAWAAETTGRITYMSADRSQLMLDNSRMYTLAKSSQAANAAVADRVELKLGGPDGKQVEEVKVLS